MKPRVYKHSHPLLGEVWVTEWPPSALGNPIVYFAATWRDAAAFAIRYPYSPPDPAGRLMGMEVRAYESRQGREARTGAA